MKKIVLMPVKNEDIFLNLTLENVSIWADIIIIADQKSTDNTLNICSKFSKVKIIDNPYEGHSNKVRWLLLDEARKIDGNNLIFCLDADELISPKSITEIEDKISKKEILPGTGLRFNWIQFWESTEKHRVDGVWKKNIKTIAFWDDGFIDYVRKYVINDHTERIPATKKTVDISYPLLHLNMLLKEKYDIKQIWYRCSEFIKNPQKVKKINNKYFVMKADKVVTAETDKQWLEEINTTNFKYEKDDDWHYKQILKWFDEYGLDYFEPLDIWDFNEFKDYFVKKFNRKPKIQSYPTWLVKLNNFKNKIRSLNIS